MPKVGILTFLRNDNYGSLLQAYALQQALISLGMEAEHIDYAPTRQEKLRNLLRSGNSPALVVDGMRKRSSPVQSARHTALSAFRQQRLRCSAPCGDEAALARAAEAYDLLLCGSDQIWSPVWLNPAYFLDFARPGQPKLAYAPSLGVARMPAPKKAEKMAELLRGFQAISVREEAGAELLRQIAGVEAEVLPDPIFLLTPEEWRSLAAPAEGAYALAYFIGENSRYWEEAERAAAQAGLPLRAVPVTSESLTQGVPLLSDISPEGWLGAIDGASLLITDSFHGAAFAHLLGTPCQPLRRYAENDPESKNSRLDQLAALTQRETLPDIRERGLGWLKAQLKSLPLEGKVPR